MTEQTTTPVITFEKVLSDMHSILDNGKIIGWVMKSITGGSSWEVQLTMQKLPDDFPKSFSSATLAENAIKRHLTRNK